MCDTDLDLWKYHLDLGPMPEGPPKPDDLNIPKE